MIKDLLLDDPDNPEDSFGFVVEWEDDVEYSATFKVFEISAISDQGQEFELKDDPNKTTPNTEYAKEYLRGHIKWDGCSNIWWDEYMHWCGEEYWLRHIRLMKYLWHRAKELIPNWDE